MLIPRDSISSLEQQLKSAKSIEDSLNIYKQLEQVWKNNGKFASASEISWRIAQKNNDAKSYAKAGAALFDSFTLTTDSTIKSYLGNTAFAAYQNAIGLDTSNLDYKIGQAEVLIDAQNNVMGGVTILLDVVKKEPNNIRANLILGRLAIVSGQLQKAEQRLKKVIALEPKNAEAYLLIAGLYETQKKTDLAVEAYKNCLKYVKNQRIKREIEIYLKNIKK